MVMTQRDKDYLAAKIDSEGFNYTFIHYSDFKDILDPKFHELRKAYIKAEKNLARYIGLEDF
jgi:hypothetical protein